MTSTSLLQLVDNLQQAGKIRNLQQVCGVTLTSFASRATRKRIIKMGYRPGEINILPFKHFV
jgi:hypothetical protein